MHEKVNLIDLLTERSCKFSSVLDVGCGERPGHLAEIYIDRNKFGANHFCGIDKYINVEEVITEFKGMVGYDKCRDSDIQNGNVTFIQGDVTNMISFPADKYDLIILSNFLHRLKEKSKAYELYEFLIEMLSPGGYAFIKIANEYNNEWKENKNARNYKGPLWGMTEDELKQFVKLTIIDQGDSGSYNRYALVKK